MTLNGVIALILRFFTEFDSFAGRLCHSGWRYTYNVRKILSLSSSLSLLAKTNAGLAERRFLADELTLSYSQLSADGWPLWVNRPLKIIQLGQLSLSSFRGRYMSSELQLDVRHLNRWKRHLVNAYEVKAGMVFISGKTVW